MALYTSLITCNVVDKFTPVLEGLRRPSYTHRHIWRFCTKLLPFWEEVAKLIPLIRGGGGLDLNHSHFYFTVRMKDDRMTMIPHLLNVCKSLIPLYWRKRFLLLSIYYYFLLSRSDCKRSMSSV